MRLYTFYKQEKTEQKPPLMTTSTENKAVAKTTGQVTAAAASEMAKPSSSNQVSKGFLHGILGFGKFPRLVGLYCSHLTAKGG